ncbi:MAG: efflux RND transporter periplasmic adaptor subunit [Bacteroidota bacterium]
MSTELNLLYHKIAMRYFTFLFCLLLLTTCGREETVTSDSASSTITAPAAAPIIPSYPTETVSVQDIERPVRITGRVEQLQEATISSQVPCLVLPTDKLLQEGKYYQRGETLVKIDHEQLLYRLQAERSQLVTSLVRLLSDLSIDYPVEHKAWEDFTNSIKADQLLPELPKITNEQLNYFISAAGIPAQYYGIKAQEVTLDDYTISAPFSGQLTMAAVNPGSFVQPGAPLAKISRTDIYEVRAALPAKAISRVKGGQKIRLYARNIDQDYTGIVHRFGPVIDQSTQTVSTFIRVSGKDLREGLYLEAELPGAALEQVAALPKEALTRDNQVYVIDEGIVRAKPVKVSLVEADRVYLNGLANGDRVITAAVNSAIIGSKAK